MSLKMLITKSLYNPKALNPTALKPLVLVQASTGLMLRNLA